MGQPAGGGRPRAERSAPACPLRRPDHPPCRRLRLRPGGHGVHAGRVALLVPAGSVALQGAGVCPGCAFFYASSGECRGAACMGPAALERPGCCGARWLAAPHAGMVRAEFASRAFCCPFPEGVGASAALHLGGRHGRRLGYRPAAGACRRRRRAGRLVPGGAARAHLRRRHAALARRLLAGRKQMGGGGGWWWWGSEPAL
jgi:hypothetical protein